MANTFVALAQENTLSLLSLTEEELLVGAMSVCGVASGLVGNPLNAVVAARAQVITDLYRCIPDPEPGFYEHPLQFTIGQTARFMEMGAVVGNIALVLGCFALHFLARWVAPTQHLPFARLVVRLGWLLFFALTQATVAFCFRLARAGFAENAAVAAVGFVVWALILGYAFFMLLRGLNVKWIPFGAGVPTEDLVKLYPELAPASDDGSSAPPPSAGAADSSTSGTYNGDDEAGVAAAGDVDGVAPRAPAAPPLIASPPMHATISGTFAPPSAGGAKKKRYSRKNNNRKLIPGERRAGKWIDTHAGRPHKERFGALFLDMRDGYRWFLVLELTLSVVYGVMEGLRSQAAHCEAASYAATVFLVLEAVVYAALQPSRLFSDNVFFDFITAGNMAAAVMLASRRTSGWSEMLVYVSIFVVACFLIIKAIVDVYLVVHAKWNRDEFLNEQEDRQAAAGSGDYAAVRTTANDSNAPTQSSTDAPEVSTTQRQQLENPELNVEMKPTQESAGSNAKQFTFALL